MHDCTKSMARAMRQIVSFRWKFHTNIFAEMYTIGLSLSRCWNRPFLNTIVNILRLFLCSFPLMNQIIVWRTKANLVRIRLERMSRLQWKLWINIKTCKHRFNTDEQKKTLVHFFKIPSNLFWVFFKSCLFEKKTTN